ncbi:MAG: hypothetical protein FXF54_04785 [Kosmotoga sp.]|nr:MAG: hypothetical protein FXF54_04785 [Kosmotoga sp.]
MDKFLKNINNSLYGVEVSDFPDDKNYIQYCQETSPPGYIIKMVLMLLAQSRLPRGGDKSEWELCITYESIRWIITDWKRYAWGIFGPTGYTEKAKKLKNKIEAAAKILDKEISKHSEIEFKNENISIHNQFYRTEGLFSYFLDSAKSYLSQKPMVVNEHNNSAEQLSKILISYINRARNIEYNLISSVIFFFSLTEVIFDACFSLGDRKSLSFSEFRHLEWSERFKFFVPLNNDSYLNKFYEKLMLTRTFYRNIPVHSSPTFFFYMEGFGLIPSSYEKLNEPHLSYMSCFNENEQQSTIDVMESAIKLLKEHKNTKFGYIYAESGLPIHISFEVVNELKKHMGTVEHFKKELNRRSEFQDRIDNMEM